MPVHMYPTAYECPCLIVQCREVVCVCVCVCVCERERERERESDVPTKSHNMGSVCGSFVVKLNLVVVFVVGSLNKLPGLLCGFSQAQGVAVLSPSLSPLSLLTCLCLCTHIGAVFFNTVTVKQTTIAWSRT